MKTFVRLVRRYVLAATGGFLLLLALCVGSVMFLGGLAQRRGNIASERFREAADALVRTDAGLDFAEGTDSDELLRGYEWAMALDDNGEVIWRYNLPASFDHRYTVSEVAGFSRWFLDDYPVFCWVEDYGLFVAALPLGSLWRANLFLDIAVAEAGAQLFKGLFVGLPLLAVALYLWFVWRGAKSLRSLSDGLETLAEGGTVCLPVKGFTAETAQKLNQTSEQLQKRSEIIARRDAARTEWIAGVSHDIRTPLALILGWGEQLARDESLPDAARQKAAGVCAQSEKIRSLIEDLNLTSKLEYGAQPLRRRDETAGPLLRRLAADFCENPLAERCTVDVSLTDEAERAVLSVDSALLARAVENLLGNSARHNPPPVHIQVTAALCGEKFRLTVIDDGAGYPPAVLRALSGQPAEGAPPHILGLHVVEQVLRAHGGTAAFTNRAPHGAKAVLELPIKA